MAWWILTTGPSLERRATAGLIEAGFEAWSPMRLVRFKTRYMKSAAEREYPTFPGYVFARPSGVVPIWEWRRALSDPDPRTGRCHPFGPEFRCKIGEESRIAEPCELRDVDGVHSVLMAATGVPLAIADAEMARVREHLEGIAAKPVDADVWRKDDIARISDVRSPFYGQVAAIARGPRRGSVQVLLSLFGRQTATEIAVEQLERAA